MISIPPYSDRILQQDAKFTALVERLHIQYTSDGLAKYPCVVGVRVTQQHAKLLSIIAMQRITQYPEHVAALPLAHHLEAVKQGEQFETLIASTLRRRSHPCVRWPKLQGEFMFCRHLHPLQEVRQHVRGEFQAELRRVAFVEEGIQPRCLVGSQRALDELQACLPQGGADVPGQQGEHAAPRDEGFSDSRGIPTLCHENARAHHYCDTFRSQFCHDCLTRAFQRRPRPAEKGGDCVLILRHGHKGALDVLPKEHRIVLYRYAVSAPAHHAPRRPARAPRRSASRPSSRLHNRPQSNRRRWENWNPNACCCGASEPIAVPAAAAAAGGCAAECVQVQLRSAPRTSCEEERPSDAALFFMIDPRKKPVVSSRTPICSGFSVRNGKSTRLRVRVFRVFSHFEVR
mmetsp:Transcript_6844/g.17503  ORF Transcript_6844/g.17503 Transcript_6844/m.17503 type:complete len:402 (+) Transcript_6844:4771-5976(+)